MLQALPSSLARNFLGGSPRWYKFTIVAFLVANPIVFLAIDPFVGGWLLVAEFIFTLAIALTCYPLQPGGCWRSKPSRSGWRRPPLCSRTRDRTSP